MKHKKIKINLAKSAGFCFGVKRAIKIAKQITTSDLRIEMLGPIVHNEDVSREIEAGGVKTVKSIKEGKKRALLIRAHGTPLKTIQKAKALGYKIIDATCPMVKEIHKIAINMEQKNYRIIVIGDKDHAEVKGIIGHLEKKALVIENEKTVPTKNIKKIKKACVVVQSTQNTRTVEKIIVLLKQSIKDLKFFNTVCQTTRTKQTEIRTMPLENDVMFIIGSKNSANTKRLYEISKSINNKSYWIQSDNDIRKNYLIGYNNIGITAGASTPDSTTKKIIEKIRKLTAKAK